eukprot:gene19322-25185_t
MIDARPFTTIDDLLTRSYNIWIYNLDVPDWLEAFKAHPKIGDIESVKAKHIQGKNSFESEEQSGANNADVTTLNSLAKGNLDYEQKFGFIFLICATGKSADEMLYALMTRLHNNREDEILIAAEEQAKITKLRLIKLLKEITSEITPNSKL